MWPLYRSEFEYQKYSFIIALVFFSSICFFVMSRDWSGVRDHVTHLLGFMMAITSIVWFIRIMRMLKEKSIRHIMMLPRMTSEIAWVRVSVIPVYWLALVTVYCLFFFVFQLRHFQIEFLWYILSYMGIIYALNGFFYIYADLQQLFQKKWEKGVATAIFVITLISVMLIINAANFQKYLDISAQPLEQTRDLIEGFAFMPAGAALFLTIGLALTLAEIALFNRRVSYLE